MNRFIILLLLFLPFSIFSCSEGSENQREERGNLKTPVRAERVKAESIDQVIKSTGTLNANEEVELTAEASGKIVAINFKEGERVKRGDVLLKLNTAELEARKRSVEYELELQEQRKERRKKLLEKEAVSREELDEVITSVNALKAEVDVIQSQIDLATITAPFDGKIGVRMVSEGAYITPGTTVASLVDYSRLKLEFTVPERYSTAVNHGTPVTFEINGSDSLYTAEIYTIEPKVNASTRTFKVRAIVENVDSQLLPGTFTKVQLILASLDDALLIPNESVLQEIDGKQVYLVSEERIEVRKIETGIRFSDRIQVTEGLREGEVVVTSGILNIREGQEVEIINELD